MRLSAIFSICSSTTTELPSSVVSESGALVGANRTGEPAGAIWAALVRTICSPPPDRMAAAKSVGCFRSRPTKPGVSALATFSAMTRWRASSQPSRPLICPSSGMSATPMAISRATRMRAMGRKCRLDG